jgi:hypothetical protein
MQDELGKNVQNTRFMMGEPVDGTFEAYYFLFGRGHSLVELAVCSNGIDSQSDNSC